MGVTPGHYPLSCGQRWLVYLFEQAKDLARPVQRIYRSGRDFNSSAFLEALQTTVASHPALRLRLVRSRQGWRQHFPDIEVVVSGEEITGRTPEMRAAYASMLMAAEAKKTLDLRKEPPVKVKIVKLDEEYLLSICIDHIAADETGFDLFEKELIAAYETIANGRPYAPTEWDAFPDYLSREAGQQQAEESNGLYWQQLLSTALVNGEKEDRLSWVPASVLHYDLSGKAFQQLLDFCRVSRCSVFHAVVAAQLMLLAGAGDQDPIVLNIPVSNRPRASERSIIANLSMLLHIPFSIIPNEPATQLVTRVRDQVLKAMAHRQYDYPSLSHFVAGESKKKGFHTSWLCGCNFVVDNAPAVFPNTLFEERMDNMTGRSYDIPKKSFTLAARQYESSLRFAIDWDAGAWGIPGDAMQERLVTILQKFRV